MLKDFATAFSKLGSTALEVADGIERLGTVAYKSIVLPMKYEQLIYEIDRVRFWKALTLGLTYSEKTYQVPPFAEWKKRKINHA